MRSRLLDFVLELSEKFSGDLNDKQIKEQSNQFDATNLFNNTIFGDGTTILLGTGNVQHVTSKVTKNDFEALSKILANQGVLEEDLEALKKAIEEDKVTVDHEQREYGPAVKSWVQTMLSKAVDGIWQIKLGVAGNLIAAALNNYYGWI